MGSRRKSSPSSLDQVEGVEEHAPVIAPVAQPVEYRQAIIVASYGLAIDQTGAAGKLSDGCGDCGIAAGPVVPPAASRRTSIRKPSCLIS
jgi:hypothetical protein